jgi:protein-disulfide isomerase/uncharacterized membrane protein
MRLRSSIVSLLALAGLALSLILLSKHYGIPLLGEAALQACGEGGGCDIVDQSRFARFLGIPLAAYGVFFYGSLLALVAPIVLAPSAGEPESEANEESQGVLALAFLLVAFALVVDIVLLGLQAFVIRAFCSFCLWTYAVNVAALIALFSFRAAITRRVSRFIGDAPRAASWALASTAVALAAFATNEALAAKKDVANASILGVPSSLAPNPPQPAEGSVEEQLQQAQAEARRWKETLDDPQKLQTYMNQKMADEYNQTEKVRVDTSRAPFKGSANAPITVVEFADFMCPFCRELAGAFGNYVRGAGGRVKVHFKHFPLDTTCNPKIGRMVHEGACDLARGAICADESGRFWEFHDQVFARPWERATHDDVLRLGVAAGLDATRFAACLDSAATKGRLSAEIDEGWSLGVGSTPTVFVNNRKLKAPNVFLIAVDEETKRLGLAPAAAQVLPNQ